MICQQELEVAALAVHAKSRIIADVLKRYLAGEAIEHGFHTIGEFARLDRRATCNILRKVAGDLEDCLLLERERRLTNIQIRGDWASYFGLFRDYWRARLEIWRLKAGVLSLLYRLEIVDIPATRRRINEYLRAGT